MILFFTGTGNSLAAASKLAEAFNERLVDIGKAIKHGQFDFELQDGERLGFVFPTYAWSKPLIIDEFLSRVRFRGPQGEPCRPGYSFVVLTCGAFVGNTARSFEADLDAAFGIQLDASYSVKTVGNCVYLYGPAEGRERDAILAKADRKTDFIIEQIRGGARGHFETRNPLGIIGSWFMKHRGNAFSTKEFYAQSTCTKCGICIDICPTNTISIVDKKPHWESSGCTQCLACIHRCPAHAIQYGHSTETRGRYIHPALLNQ